MKWVWEDTGAPPAAAFQQSAAYAIAAEAGGGRVERAVLRSGGQVLAQAQLLRRAGVTLVLRGPVWGTDLSAAEQRQALRRLALQRPALIAMPERAVAGLGLVPLMTPRHVALWDLRPDPADLRGALAGKWRNALRTAERRGVRATRAPVSQLASLVTAEAAQRQLRRYRALPSAFSAALPPDAVRLWQWQSHAALCFVRHGTWATYHIGHADTCARAAGAHRVLLWQAALALRAEGVTLLDLGDINTEDAPGLARFKLGTGAGLHRLGPTCLVLPG